MAVRSAPPRYWPSDRRRQPSLLRTGRNGSIVWGRLTTRHPAHRLMNPPSASLLPTPGGRARSLGHGPSSGTAASTPEAVAQHPHREACSVSSHGVFRVFVHCAYASQRSIRVPRVGAISPRIARVRQGPAQKSLGNPVLLLLRGRTIGQCRGRAGRAGVWTGIDSRSGCLLGNWRCDVGRRGWIGG
jgi:hypothetical protein